MPGWDPTNGSETQAPSENPVDLAKARADRAGLKAAVIGAKEGGGGGGGGKKGERIAKLEAVEVWDGLTRRLLADNAKNMPTESALLDPVLAQKKAFVAGVIADRTGLRMPLLIDLGTRTARKVPIKSIAQEIVRYGRQLPLAAQQLGFKLGVRQATDAAEYWLASAPIMPTPPPFGFLSDPALVMHRCPFDPLEGPTPHFDEFFVRMRNATAVKAWIGSLFDRRSDRQQYVYLHGQGGDGKGAMARALARAFGEGATSVSAPPQKNKHWACDYIDRRLVIFSDLVDGRAFRCAELRSVTGGDEVTVDPKGQQSYKASLDCKLLVCSNNMPELENNAADKRRIIFADMTAPAPETGALDYEDNLWAEMPALIAECIAVYVARKNGGRGIKLLDHERFEIEAWADLGDESFRAFFREFFVVDNVAQCSARAVAERLRMRDGRPNGPFAKAWHAWFRREHPQLAHTSVTKWRGENVRSYRGFRERQPLSADGPD